MSDLKEIFIYIFFGCKDHFVNFEFYGVAAVAERLVSFLKSIFAYDSLTTFLFVPRRLSLHAERK